MKQITESVSQSENNFLKSRDDESIDMYNNNKDTDRAVRSSNRGKKKITMKEYIDTILQHEHLEEDSYDLKQKNQASDDDLQEDKD